MVIDLNNLDDKHLHKDKKYFQLKVFLVMI